MKKKKDRARDVSSNLSQKQFSRELEYEKLWDQERIP